MQGLMHEVTNSFQVLCSNHHFLQVQLVLLDALLPLHPNFPSITLWKGFPPLILPIHQRQQREAWSRDWTFTILLSGISGQQPVPAAYGNNDRVLLDTTWRLHTITRCVFVFAGSSSPPLMLS